MEQRIRATWRAAAGGTRPAEAAIDDLISRHREPHRRYHGVRHLAHVLDEVIRLAVGLDPVDRRRLVAAACFHDAVYDPRSASNEADSAALAARVLGELGWDAADLAEVTRLVLATRTHEASDERSQILLDADLAVLGADPAAYADYVRGVREEYSFVDDEAWRAGRAAVLTSFLDRKVLFHTDEGRRREPRARANLAAELATLTQ